MKFQAIISTILLLGAALNAETAGVPGQSVEVAPKKASAIAGIDVRPSWTTKSGEFHTENSIMLGVKTASDLAFSFVHNFNTNLFQPKPEEAGGVNPTAQDGSFRASLPAIWTSADSSFSLTYAPRVYVPIVDTLRTAGQITAVRNYFNLKKTLSPALSMTLSEVPIIHAYSQPGSVTSDGPSANPVLENRVYLTTDVKLTEKLGVSLPVMFHVTRYRPFLEGAKNDNSLGYFLWVFPELTYALPGNTSLGLAYYSDNLIDAKGSGLTLTDGLEKGVLQVSIATAL